MTFSPELEARFDKLLRSYPPGRERAAMIPMLMYAQDEIGSVTEELIDEVARRVERATQRLGIVHKEVTADRQISLEEVECIGACSWAPAIQVNYDFHHFVTPRKLDELLDTLEKKQ